MSVEIIERGPRDWIVSFTEDFDERIPDIDHHHYVNGSYSDVPIPWGEFIKMFNSESAAQKFAAACRNREWHGMFLAHYYGAHRYAHRLDGDAYWEWQQKHCAPNPYCWMADQWCEWCE